MQDELSALRCCHCGREQGWVCEHMVPLWEKFCTKTSHPGISPHFPPLPLREVSQLAAGRAEGTPCLCLTGSLMRAGRPGSTCPRTPRCPASSSAPAPASPLSGASGSSGSSTSSTKVGPSCSSPQRDFGSPGLGVEGWGSHPARGVPADLLVGPEGGGLRESGIGVLSS